MRRRVFVVGSCRHLEDPRARSEFVSTAEAIGKALSGSFDIVICSLSETTVDRHIISGALADGGISPLAYMPDNYLTRFQDDTTSLRNSTGAAGASFLPLVNPVAGGWRVTHLRAIAASDLVIAIGGNERGTGTVIYSAEALGKPVLLLPHFGGATGEAWRDMKHHYSDDDQSILRGIGGDSIAWSSTFASFCKRFMRRNPMRRHRSFWPAGLLLTTLLLVASWIWIFNIDSWPTVPYTTAATISTCGLGIVFRRSIEMDAPRAEEFVVDVVQAIVIGLSIVLLAQGASYLTGADTENAFLDTDHASLALRFGAVGFLAGFARSNFIDWVVRRATLAFATDSKS